MDDAVHPETCGGDRGGADAGTARRLKHAEVLLARQPDLWEKRLDQLDGYLIQLKGKR
jgi:hypothetical protein